MRTFTALAIGVAVGAAAVAFVPVLAPEMRRYARPTAKALLKAGLAAVETVRIYAAELSEDVEDLVVETQAERMQEAAAERAQAAKKARPAAKKPRKKAASRKRAPKSKAAAA